MLTRELSLEVTRLHADFCSALADPRRLMIIYALASRPQTVNELSKSLGISQPSTSRHLKVLRERGLVRATRNGVSIEYRLSDYRLIEALDLLRAVLRDRLAYRASLLENERERTK